MDPDPKLRDLFDAPIVERDWKGYERTERNQQLFRYGLHWTIYDMVGKKEFQWRPGILTPERFGSIRDPEDPLFGWIRGGFDVTVCHFL